MGSSPTEISMKRPNATRLSMRLALGVVLIVTSSLAALPAAAASDSDAVLVWNQQAVNALSLPLPTAVPPPPVPGGGQPPPVASQHLAMVQGAVYDAVNAIDGGYQPYLRGLPSAPGASKAAAVATAAHHVLVGLRPVSLPQVVRDNLDVFYDTYMAGIADGQAKTDGIAIGAAAAVAMLNERDGDGRYVPYSFTVGTEAGEWRPTGPGFVNDPFAWVSNVRPFTLKSTSQLRTEGPLELTSGQYAAEFNEVKAVGAATGSTRTAEQTLIAQFYVANPVPFMNAAFRNIAAQQGLSTADQARLFAKSSMGVADALISCWDDKDYWSFWRPVTAIQEAADDDNPATSPQADWTPFIAAFLPTATPPYPDHPSGYNCISGSMMRTAREFFGTDHMAITLASPTGAAPRTYDRFSDVVRDTIDARIYLGIHFRTPDVQGAWIGKKAAQWVDKHYFQPLK
jgi:hypothetical protein